MTTLGNFGSSKAASCVCLLLVLCATSTCAAMELVRSSDVNGNKRQTTNNSSKSDATVFYMDLANPSITQPVEPGEVAGAKFVQVEVTEVANLKKYPLSFEVRYQAKGDARIYLGSFALYPSDNPGKFIVATQGKVKGDGAIVLTLVVSEKVDPGDAVKVGIKRIRLVKA